ncbi:unnamed protein product, partial [Prorocentrum cordatum]
FPAAAAGAEDALPRLAHIGAPPRRAELAGAQRGQRDAALRARLAGAARRRLARVGGLRAKRLVHAPGGRFAPPPGALRAQRLVHASERRLPRLYPTRGGLPPRAQLRHPHARPAPERPWPLLFAAPRRRRLPPRGARAAAGRRRPAPPDAAALAGAERRPPSGPARCPRGQPGASSPRLRCAARAGGARLRLRRGAAHAAPRAWRRGGRRTVAGQPQGCGRHGVPWRRGPAGLQPGLRRGSPGFGAALPVPPAGCGAPRAA